MSGDPHAQLQHLTLNRLTDVLVGRSWDEAYQRLKGPYLVYLSTTNEPTIYDLDQILTRERPILKIGRDEDCDIVLSEKSVSRNHAVIARSKNRWMLSDQVSTYGTYLGGSPVMTPVEVRSRDKIRIGRRSELHFLSRRGLLSLVFTHFSTLLAQIKHGSGERVA